MERIEVFLIEQDSHNDSKYSRIDAKLKATQ